jgi:hypothetical protein
MSSRDFVQNVLPGLQSRSPRLLDGKAESVLEHEIDNENARMVRGDGVETTSSKLNVKEEIEEEDESGDTESESGDDDEYEDLSSQAMYPSWGRTTPRVSRARRLSVSSGDDVDLDWTSPNTMDPPSTSCAPRQDVPGIRRIKSSLSVLIPEPSPAPAIALPVRRNHQRRLSAASFGISQPNGGHVPKLNVSSIHAPIPSPSIRRSSTSHPDITSLVQQWTSFGPANQTMLYKPQQTSASSS